MKLSTAISKRIVELCEEKEMSINKLAINSCITQSTLHSIIKEESENPKLLTLFRICDGLEIDINYFFNSRLFSNIDREI